MMYGTFLINCWGALMGFTVYFLLSIRNPLAVPSRVLLGSFIAAIILFGISYLVRMFLYYVLFTPEELEIVYDESDEVIVAPTEMVDVQPLEQTLSNEIGEEQTEDVAKVVRSMMQAD